jgi:hypothetical protein
MSANGKLIAAGVIGASIAMCSLLGTRDHLPNEPE